MVLGNESPIGDYACDTNIAVWSSTSDKIFNTGSVEELDVGEGKDLGEEGRCEESLPKVSISLNLYG